MSKLAFQAAGFSLYEKGDGTGFIDLGHHANYFVNSTVLPELLSGGPEAVETWIEKHDLRRQRRVAYPQMTLEKIRRKKPQPQTHTALNNKYLVRREAEYIALGYPDEVAIAQASWDLNCLFYWGYCNHATLSRMAKRFDRTSTAVRQRVNKYTRMAYGWHDGVWGPRPLGQRLSPIERYQQEGENFDGWVIEHYLDKLERIERRAVKTRIQGAPP